LSLSENAAGLAHVTLVLGGARSGKSRHAQSLAMVSLPPWTYIATAEARDEEMQARIAQHRRVRGAGWSTLEAPIDLAGALGKADASAPVVVDCLTLWLTNLMLGGHDVKKATRTLNKALLRRRNAPTILVSNEVGLGIVPETPLGRAVRDEAGTLNQRIAERAGRVILMVAGLPLDVKGG
jgi:adenosylcobinamide kinase/adenosylcobinamide-phosphate guanylyltransferase